MSDDINTGVELSWSSGPMRQPWFSLFMGIPGIALLGVCLFTTIKEIEFRKTAVRVSGTVIELRESNGAFRAIISFNDQQNREHQFVSKIASSPPEFQQGESVQVLFPPGNPGKPRIDSFHEKWLVSLITGPLGLALCVGSFLAWRFRKKMFPQTTVPESSI